MADLEIIERDPRDIDIASSNALSERAKATLNKVAAAIEVMAGGPVQLLEYARKNETELLMQMQAIDKGFLRYRNGDDNGPPGSLNQRIAEFKKKHPGKENTELADRYAASVKNLYQQRDNLDKEAAPIIKVFKKDLDAIAPEMKKAFPIDSEHIIKFHIIEAKIDKKIENEARKKDKLGPTTSLPIEIPQFRVATIKTEGLTRG